MAKKPTILKTVETLHHDEAKRKNIPTAEHQSGVNQDNKKPIRIKYPRNPDLDPQFVWRGKDEQDWSDLVVNAPPLYIQEKVHPKALIDDLLRQTKEEEHDAGMTTADLFADFDGILKDVDKTEFYAHDQNWSNRMILGDSLQVMASLAEREGLRGQVQCIYFDPPYGIKFNSNFQWSTTSRDVKDGRVDQITREPEQVKAFRDTWRDGVNSYLTYLRDRLTVGRDLLNESGSIFIQIGAENLHRVKALLDEVFGLDNSISTITVQKTTSARSDVLDNVCDYIVWYAKDITKLKSRSLYKLKGFGSYVPSAYRRIEIDLFKRRSATATEKEGKFDSTSRIYALDNLTRGGGGGTKEFQFEGKLHKVANGSFKTSLDGMERLAKSNRIESTTARLGYVRYLDDFSAYPINNLWTDAVSSFMSDKLYTVQTNTKIVQRCILMATDPGDLVIDPTCGSGTSAYVSEQWGRRWISIDTSRVALTLARSRIMGSRYPFYLLSDSSEGKLKEAEISRTPPSTISNSNNVRKGFVCERVPHITLRSIANNSEIDVIWENFVNELNIICKKFSDLIGKKYEYWNFPLEANDQWGKEIQTLHSSFWVTRRNLQLEIDGSISARAVFEYLYDRPYEDKKKVRVAGPFTVESLSPHRVMGVDENDNLIDVLKNQEEIPKQSFTQMILDNLKTSGVQQAHKENKIQFSSLTSWPGNLVCGEGRYFEGETDNKEEKRAAIFIGPEFGTVQRADLVQAAREAGDAGFDSLVACAFNYEAHATELNKLGSIPILKARMNADLHMSEDLKNTGKGNLFVIFGEPDIDIIQENDDKIRVKVNGVDVFKPQTGEVVSDGADGIACWFIDTDYNEESFFVRQAYFLGANDPYSSLKRTLKTEINADAWTTLNSDTSRPFPKPKSGRIAVKVINHLGDEVMKVFKV